MLGSAVGFAWFPASGTDGSEAGIWEAATGSAHLTTRIFDHLVNPCK
jgi:hypothetical protein